jgi:hypothetical protein
MTGSTPPPTGNLAPHADPKWTQALVLELRLQGVAGDRIGEVLSEVESHLAESGQRVEQAFGDPVSYARSLQLPTSPHQSMSATFALAAPVLLQGLGLVIAAFNLRSDPQGQAVVTWGHLATIMLLVAAVMVLIFYSGQALRVMLRGGWIGAVLLGMTTMLLLALPMVLLPVAAFDLPRWLSIAIGAAVFLAGSSWLWIANRRAQDEVRSPLK